MHSYNSSPLLSEHAGADGSYCYTTDLLELEHSSLDRATVVDSCLVAVDTPLVLSSWK